MRQRTSWRNILFFCTGMKHHKLLLKRPLDRFNLKRSEENIFFRKSVFLVRLLPIFFTIVNFFPLFFICFLLTYRAISDGEFSLKSSAAMDCSIALSKLLGRTIFIHKLHPDVQSRYDESHRIGIE